MSLSGTQMPTTNRPEPATSPRSSRWEWRLRVYPVAVIAVLAAVVVLAALAETGTGGEDERLGGDYPSFYGAGSLVLDGDWDSLYDESAQRQAQSGLVTDEGGFLYFAYPPPVAAAYAPLAALGYRWSYLLHTVLMGLALGGAVSLARPLFPLIDRYPMASYAMALFSYPLFRAVLGGQNTSLTLLLVVAATRLDRANRPFALGAIVGLMLYKPQFGLVFLALLFVRRRWISLASAGGMAAGLWAATAAALGIGWLGDWWSQALSFAGTNVDANAANFVSLPGALEPVLGAPGAFIGWAFAAVLTAALIGLVWLDRRAEHATLYALTAAVSVLVLPQPLFYEAGLLALLAAVVVQSHRGRRRIVALAAAATWVQPLSGPLGSLPLMLVVLGFTLWSGNTLVARQSPFPPLRAESRS